VHGFVGTGLCDSLTTYSTVSYETQRVLVSVATDRVAPRWPTTTTTTAAVPA
jgi:fluoride ion exporter CrcB/FEX